VRIWDLFYPTPPPTDDELDLVEAMRPSRYGLRVAGWVVRSAGAAVALTWVVRIITNPAFRARVRTWRFLAEAGAALLLLAVVAYVMGATLLAPSLRRIAERRRSAQPGA
jgi:hypothetical protein